MNEKVPPIISKPKEHLKEGINPIVVCIGTFEDFENEKALEIPENINNNFGLKDAKDMDWMSATYGGTRYGADGPLTSGPETYVISPIDSSDKISKVLSMCTGVVISGKDKITGENISFATHGLSLGLTERMDIFMKDFKIRLQEMKEKCEPDTVDAIIFGGKYLSGYKEEFLKMYEDTIQILSHETEQVFGFEPKIVNGPKTTNTYDDMYYDNKNRRLYFIRQKVNSEAGDFVASDVERVKDSWNKGTLENPIIDSNMTREEALRPNPEFQIPQEIFERQAVITVKYLSFDGKYHQGQIVMDKELEQDVKDFFEFLLKQNFKVKKVVPIAHEDYNFSDAKSMADNNTSGFNPRYKVGLVNANAETELSEHAKGRAFDLNPLINPYFGGPGKIPVTPIHPEDTEGERDPSEYVEPDDEEEGEESEFEYYNIDNEGTVAPWIAEFLRERGWDWGMEWYKEENQRVDTQHFEKKFDENSAVE